ncbi:cytochrome C oxidase subunit IV family protein [Sphingobium sp. DEHP117]|uniref:cytochrome C oxidase subunit IV family protein n=1 Tax=Sphingobium sp. DEHP117 TaxID=2993436 RepID=UPI0027D580FB|nr:cytochrome C oxidase subunit IV family protein [Sphingobium sp. DEHP117]MDQ4420370.1 cytochrome C oxidase subunit IV family protein [Sphingobium sp. DEHP117]
MRFFVVWLLLIAATLASFAIGEDVKASPVTTAIILAIAIVKVRFVIQEFMEVRAAPLLLSIATDLWAAVLWVALVAIPYLV